MIKENHPHAQAREWALQFLYQCEIEKVYFFSESHFDLFTKSFSIVGSSTNYLRRLIEGVFQHLPDLSEKIEALSEHWNLSRMPVIDRCILRLAAFELLYSDTHKRIVINEAIELAKKYSTENSGSFVNGILDKLARESAETEA